MTLVYRLFWDYWEDSFHKYHLFSNPLKTSLSFHLSLTGLELCHDIVHRIHRTFEDLPEFSASFRFIITCRFLKSTIWSPCAKRQISMETTSGSLSVDTVTSIWLSKNSRSNYYLIFTLCYLEIGSQVMKNFWQSWHNFRWFFSCTKSGKLPDLFSATFQHPR